MGVAEAVIPAGQNSYRTNPDRPRSIFSKIFLSPRVTFYFQVSWIIWKNSRKALKGKYPSEKWAESSFEIIHALENIGAFIEISGLEHLKNFDGPAVFISNHMSTLETLILPSIIQPLKPVNFVVKKSLVKMPVFGPIMRSRDPILVSRTNAREDLKTVLEQGTEKLRNGQSIVVFPQSTRSFTFNPEEFNSLGIKLALKANVPVVPVALKTDAWGIGKRFKDFGPIDIRKKIHFAFGEQMTIRNRGADEHQKVICFITEHLNAWSKE
jgi:1-acyl-sn-glycerol-3-phosphate acyltransferase